MTALFEIAANLRGGTKPTVAQFRDVLVEIERRITLEILTGPGFTPQLAGLREDLDEMIEALS